MFGLCLIWIFCVKKHATNRNWHQALDQYVSPKKSYKMLPKVCQSCIILAWNNKKLQIRWSRINALFFPKITYIPKIFPISFYPFWTLFDMDFLQNYKHTTNRNWHWALDQYVSSKNSIKSCQKYVKVVEYWHGTIKNYRYDGDVSSNPPGRIRNYEKRIKNKF